MIRSFADSETKKIFKGRYSKKLPEDIQRRGQRKLVVVHAAEELDDLRIPPGNRLEKLTGNREGQYSIRINRQWRICFQWKDGNAHDVEVTDYH